MTATFCGKQWKLDALTTAFVVVHFQDSDSDGDLLRIAWADDTLGHDFLLLYSPIGLDGLDENRVRAEEDAVGKGSSKSDAGCTAGGAGELGFIDSRQCVLEAMDYEVYSDDNKPCHYSADRLLVHCHRHGRS